jgi:hypothetical protein
MFRRKKNNLLALYAQEITAEAIDVLSWRRRHRRQRLILFLTYVVWILSGIMVVLLINVLIFFPSLKRLYWQALTGKGDLEKVALLASSGNWSEVNKVSTEAAVNFASALNDLKKIRLSPIGWLPFTHGKLNDGVYLLSVGSLVSQSLAQGSAAANNFLALLPDKKTFDLSSLNQEQKLALMKLIVASQDGLAEAKSNLAEAQADLSKITNRQLIMNQGVDLDGLAAKIDQNEVTVTQALDLSRALPILGGYPTATKYLFILQNNDELRPTGGFIGTYGLAQTAGGNLSLLETHDVYHLDMPVKDRFKTEPPPELKKYLGVNNWYLRDANWSPDWPTSAQKIAWFYTQENNLLPQPNQLDNLDLIIGLTPKAITDLLALTGPIAVNGQVYNQTNFVDLLQTTVEKDYAAAGLSSWDRKTVIGDLTKALEAKILANLKTDWSQLLAIITTNLDQKNILVYTTNPVLHEQLVANDWLDEVKTTTGDYLLVVDANMGALKTDAVVNKSLIYTLQETADGLVAKVNINYANNGNYSWKTTTYRSFTRVYVPQGSQLIKAAGHSGAPQDIVTGEELGKTYFGALVEIAPGKIGGLSFEYKLPYNLYALAKSGSYSLLVQKQPGSRLGQLNLDLQFKQPIRYFDPAIFYAYAVGSRFLYKSDLVTDKQFTIRFSSD